jgi:hypothetical protein
MTKTKKKNLTASDLVAIGADLATGTSRRDAMAAHPDVPERLIRAIQQSGIGVEEYRARVAAEFQSAALESVASFRQDLAAGEVAPATKPIAAGIFFDKAALASGGGNRVDLNVTINQIGGGFTKQDILARLFAEEVTVTPVLGHAGDPSEPIVPSTDSATPATRGASEDAEAVI